jgi:membrane-associated protease RseP (regulator of RpoE activity)
MVALTIFEIIDLTVLALLLIVLSIYLYKNKKRLGTDGILLLYRTQWGVKLIDKIGKKYQKTLKFLSYVSVGVGYILMAGIIYLLGNTVWQYLTNPLVVEAIKAPPIAPLIPYFPRLFGLQSFFPPFYALYFIAAILIVATVHEFAHGIFARRYGVRIKSTGFAFLKFFPAIFGAFVEQEEKDMEKTKKFEQMSILSAGVFANVIVGVLAFILLIVFFNLAFAPSGAVFYDYVYEVVPIAGITSIANITLENPDYEQVIEILNNTNNGGLVEIKSGGKNYVGIRGFVSGSEEYLALYRNLPAINSGLKGILVEIDGVKANTFEELREVLLKHSPGETVSIKNGKGETFEFELAEHPNAEGLPYLGITNLNQRKGLLGSMTHYLSALQQKNLYLKNNSYYAPSFYGAEFWYYLLWWIVMINVLVALFNMLPLGILDGGRFFYLTFLSLTGSEKGAKRAFSFLTYLILFAFIALMVKWTLRFF